MNLNRTQPWVIALAMTGVVCADPLMNTAGMMGVSRTSSSYLMGQASLDVGVSAKADYAYEGARIHYFGEEVRQNPVLLSQDIYLAFGMTNWMDVSVDLPMYEDIWKNHDYYPSGVGDLQLGVKIQHPGLYLEAPFRLAYQLRASLPTGDKGSGYMPRHTYMSGNDTNSVGAFTERNFALNPTLIWTLDLSKFPSRTPLQIHGNAGVMALMQNEYGQNQQYTTLMGSLAAEYQTCPSMGVFAEISGESRLKNYNSGFNFLGTWNRDVLRASVGTTFKAKSGLHGSVGLDVGLSQWDETTSWYRHGLRYDATNTPLVGVNLKLGFSQKGTNAHPILGRFFAKEDTITVVRRDTITKNIVRVDTVKVIKIKIDTVKILETQNPKTIIQYGVVAFRSVNFTNGSNELTQGSYPSLDDIAASLLTYPQVRIEVRGYTDDVGSAEANVKLSQGRAESVVTYLVSKGVKADRLKATGLGAANPVADNKTADGRVLNRRVEIRRLDDAK
jgi:outer membrane protein OmpA-like peptidoglycan-associated protein